jgi:amino acid transporter
MVKKNRKVGKLKPNVHRFIDLATLSNSSVAPAFSIAASYGVIAMILGFNSIMAIILTLPVWLGAAFIFRKFNKIHPDAGASYVWGRKIVSKRYGSFQAWVVTLAYFFSIPPIVIPAGEYTDALLYSTGIIPKTVYSSPDTIFIIGTLWITITLIASILGAKPIARLTEIFFAVEIAIISSFIVISIYFLPSHIVNPVSITWFFGFGNVLKNPYIFMLGFPVIATIMDGWEIDSYASEESVNKERWPGTTGIIGLISVFIVYMVTMTLMDMETPMYMLSGSLDPLSTWSTIIIPKYSFMIDIAVIASTASSLWLTTYILSRAWYAMARDGLFPEQFGRLHKKYKTPYLNITIIGIAAESINAVMLFVPSIESFFAELLSVSGIFLMMEFGIDCFTGIYLYTHKNNIKWHKIYLFISIFSFTGFIAMILLGLVTDITFLILFIILIVPAIILIGRTYISKAINVSNE